MKRFILLLSFLLLLFTSSFAIKVDTIHYGKFGKITIYHPEKSPTSVALFVSGDGGWEHGVINMARNVARQGALVLGIDAKHYAEILANSKEKCSYPAADFEQLSLMIQKKYRFSNYSKPVLIGYSYGATLVYGILAQAPANTFKGAIGIGFCPDIDLKHPLCKGSGLAQHLLKPGNYYLERTESLTAPFIVLNGVKDQTCPFEATAAYLKGMPMTELVALQKVGHGFKISDGWLTSFNRVYGKILNEPSYLESKINTANLHLPEVKTFLPLPPDVTLAIIPSSIKNNLPILFMVSGDGGWTSFDQSLAEAISKKGITVIGLDAQKYFWNAKTPEKTTADVAKIMTYYLRLFDKKTFVFAGYSFGASVIPFIASRLPVGLKEDLIGLVSISPDAKADFEIHISEMLDMGSEDDTYNVISEMKKNKSIKATCFFGAEEDQEIKDKFLSQGLKVVVLPGNHHFNNNYALIAESLFNYIKKP